MASAKRALRRQMRRARASIPHRDRVRAARRAAAHLRQLAEALGSRVAGLYASTADELCTAAAAAELRRAGLALAYPRIIPAERRLVFHRVPDPSWLQPGMLGIREPSRSLPRTPIEQIDLFVVPGLAFDARGTRLGWGQGYYDRLFARTAHAVRVGFAYEAQIVSFAPNTERDVPMHHIVTDTGITDCSPRAAPSVMP